MEHLDTYFYIAYKKIDDKVIVSMMKDQINLMSAPDNYKHDFISSIEDWCIEQKPNADNVLQWCKRLMSLEERLMESCEF